MSILRELALKLGLDMDAQAFAKGELAASALKLGLEKVVEVAHGLAESFVENIKQTAEYGEKIHSLSQQTGISTKTLQEFGQVAAVGGIGLDEIGQALGSLSRKMVDARDGGEESSKTFRRLGVSVTDGAGQLRDAGDVFKDISEKYGEMANGAEKNAITQELFRRGGQKLIDMLNEGSEAFEKYKLPVISDEQIEAANELEKTQRALGQQTEWLWKSAIGPLLPALRKLLDRIYEWKKANAEVIRQNLEKVISAGIAVVNGLGKAFKFVMTTVKLFKDEWKIFAVALLGTLAAIAVANADQVLWWLVVQNAAVGAAFKTAKAWVLAAAPFVLIGGLILGIAALMQDVAMDDELGDKADTLTGRLRRFVAELGKPAGNEPWWVGALRTANEFMQNLVELHKVFKDESPTEWMLGVRAPSNFSALTPAAAVRAQRLADEQPVEEEGFFSRGARHVANAVFGQPMDQRPYWTGAGASPYGNLTQNTVEVHVHPTPGMSEERVAAITVQKLAEHGVVGHAQLEAAHAAAP